MSDRGAGCFRHAGAEGAEAHGFKGELWTRKRVAVLILREFGVRYHPGHVSKLLKDLGWSSQEPERRASQHNELL
jgi:transposase